MNPNVKTTLSPALSHRMGEGEIRVRPTMDVEFLDYHLHRYGSAPERRLLSYRNALENPQNIFLQVTRAGVRCGFFALRRKSPGVYEPHVCLDLTCRGVHAIAATRAMCHWMFEHTECWSLCGFIPRANKPALIIALRAGFRASHRNRESVYITLNRSHWKGELCQKVI